VEFDAAPQAQEVDGAGTAENVLVKPFVSVRAKISDRGNWHSRTWGAWLSNYD
jgi:hypothetical protein